MILIGKDQLGWIQWTLANQITTTPPPKTKRQKRTRPAKKVTTTLATTVTTMITTVSATKSSKKHRRKTKPMTATSKLVTVASTTNPPKTAMSIIKDHDTDSEINEANIGEIATNSSFSSMQTQDMGCSNICSQFSSFI